MIWPGMGDPAKRRRTIRYLIITAAIGVGVAAASSGVQIYLNSDNPLKVCINNKEGLNYKISATLEVYVDHKKWDVPSKAGFKDGCQRALYAEGTGGVIHAVWKDKYPFEIGHFLWLADFPMRDMDDGKSKMYVNDKESPDFIHAPLVDGYHYRADFISKAYDTSKEHDFEPPK